MENKKLAIKGHKTRGKEVIEILEMLGGKNKFNFRGNEDKWLVLNGNIQQTDFLFDEKGFTLEEFLEKYPFKVGDKVTCKNLLASDSIYVVKKMMWVNNQIKYTIHNQCHDKYNFTVFIAAAEDLQHHKDEAYIDSSSNNNSNPGVTVNGEKLIAPNGYTIGNATRNGNSLIVEYIKNKPQYPKTYKECCEVLGINTKANDAQGYKADDIICLQELLIYRDAYWKIAGEEMFLSEPWKPSANDEGKTYALYYNRCTDSLDKCEGLFESNAILDFPTKEMRDAFFENFKDVIEKCKEFL